MDARQQKAQQIVAAGTITPGNGYWLVHSQTGGHRYKVIPDGLFPSCTCADFELTEKPCKHILAVRLFLEQQEQRFAGQTVVNEIPPKPKRPTYTQDWLYSDNYFSPAATITSPQRQLLFPTNAAALY
jgi:hypothetical protein